MSKKLLSIVCVTGLLLALAVGCTAEDAKSPAAEEVKLDTQKKRISYTIGLNIGQDFARQEMEIDTDVLVLGVIDALGEKEPRMTQEEMAAEVQTYQQEMRAKQEARLKEVTDKNVEEGKAFLVENAKKDGVVVLESGLQYKVIEPGQGAKPTADSMVKVHYKGTLVDGAEFDSSYRRGQPASFPVGGVIPGWTEALLLMQEGAKWQLFIPSELAYGERGAGQDIGPNAVLIFDVELISIEKE
jgi:FKBP-type peptidyl-prolyl cis-trans isomerase FklB